MFSTAGGCSRRYMVLLLALRVVGAAPSAVQPAADPLASPENFLRELGGEPEGPTSSDTPFRATPRYPQQHFKSELDIANHMNDANFYIEMAEYLSEAFKKQSGRLAGEEDMPTLGVMDHKPPIQPLVEQTPTELQEREFGKKRNPLRDYEKGALLKKTSSTTPKKLIPSPQPIPPIIESIEIPVNRRRSVKHRQMLQNKELDERRLPLRPIRRKDLAVLSKPVQSQYLEPRVSTTEEKTVYRMLSGRKPMDEITVGPPPDSYLMTMRYNEQLRQTLGIKQPVQSLPRTRFLPHIVNPTPAATIRLWTTTSDTKPNESLRVSYEPRLQLYTPTPAVVSTPAAASWPPTYSESTTNKQGRIEKFMGFIRKNRGLLMEFIANKRLQQATAGIMGLQATKAPATSIPSADNKKPGLLKPIIWNKNAKLIRARGLLQARLKSIRSAGKGIKLLNTPINSKPTQNIDMQDLGNKLRDPFIGVKEVKESRMKNIHVENGSLVMSPFNANLNPIMHASLNEGADPTTPWSETKIRNKSKRTLSNELLVRLLATAANVITPQKVIRTTSDLPLELNPIREEVALLGAALPRSYANDVQDGMIAQKPKAAAAAAAAEAAGAGAEPYMRGRNVNAATPTKYDSRLLDLAPARGKLVEQLRHKGPPPQGRLCQRYVLNVEGPMYKRDGRPAARALEPRPGHDFARTEPPTILIPTCCDCCKKSVLGCQ